MKKRILLLMVFLLFVSISSNMKTNKVSFSGKKMVFIESCGTTAFSLDSLMVKQYLYYAPKRIFDLSFIENDESIKTVSIYRNDPCINFDKDDSLTLEEKRDIALASALPIDENYDCNLKDSLNLGQKLYLSYEKKLSNEILIEHNNADFFVKEKIIMSKNSDIDEYVLYHNDSNYIDYSLGYDENGHLLWQKTCMFIRWFGNNKLNAFQGDVASFVYEYNEKGQMVHLKCVAQFFPKIYENGFLQYDSFLAVFDEQSEFDNLSSKKKDSLEIIVMYDSLGNYDSIECYKNGCVCNVKYVKKNDYFLTGLPSATRTGDEREIDTSPCLYNDKNQFVKCTLRDRISPRAQLETEYLFEYDRFW